jgi:integrase
VRRIADSGQDTPATRESVVPRCRFSPGTTVVLAAYTGLRPGELCGLRVRRLDLLRRRVHVAETLQPVKGVLISGPPKSYENRSVPLPRFVAAQAEEHLAARAGQLGRALGPDDWVFGGQRDPADGLNRDSFRKWAMIPALRDAGLPEAVRTHDLRHTCASLLIQLGAHPRPSRSGWATATSA